MRVQEVLMLPERPTTEHLLTSDALPLCLGSELTANAKALHERVHINISDLSSIENDLSPEESARMLFLMMDWGDSAYALRQCVKIMKQSYSVRSNNECCLIMDCLMEVSQHSENKDWWKPLFLESLAVVGRLDVLHILGFDEEEIDMLKKAVHLLPKKVDINAICCNLLQEEVTKLVKYISSKYLPNDTNTTPDGCNSEHLLELHILHWMAKGVMNPSDFTPLAEALSHVGKRDLAGTALMERKSLVNNEWNRPKMNTQSSLLSIASKPYPNKCGVCVIFNQEEFSCDDADCDLLGTTGDHSKSYREGSSKDADRLAQLFTTFGCLARICTNCKAQDMDSLLEALAQAENLATFDYLVVCFLSHGNTDSSGKQLIYSSDCQKLLLEEELVRHFEAGYCPALDGKLKLVITQSCMGTDSLPVVPCVADGPRSLLASAQRDFLFCQASTPGFQAYRIPSEGSLYIRVLCQVLSELGEREQLVDCFQEVHNRLSSQRVALQRHGTVIECAVQPQMIVRTRFKFFFAKSDE